MDEFYEMNQAHIIGVEDAAFGFALSVLYAEQYNGQEIGSIQVINGTEQERHAYENCDFETLKRVRQMRFLISLTGLHLLAIQFR